MPIEVLDYNDENYDKKRKSKYSLNKKIKVHRSLNYKI